MVPRPVHAPSPAARRGPRTIALVGIDGSGKTTQAHLLADELAARGLPARYRRNAGGRHWFGKLALVFGRADAEALLGRRGMLLVESVLRWLAILRTLLRRAVTREITVMDRYAVCQYASIRARGGRSERAARLAYRVFPRPDVTFLLAVDPANAYERIERRGYDHEEMSYLRAADAAYRSLPEYPAFVIIDANGTPDQVRAALLEHLPAPFPSRSVMSVLVAHARAVLVAVASLAAAATVVTYQLVDGF
ncbi:dTMP kinase [Actinoplanes sp. RD1]|uniref:dTMP kinase n=1 Tax=Actinoplanes sp. RD1 TaxID=3064538 RepID=UPI0027424A87|nr:dTMP kinase [Actinoplanes sp. RD1]